MQALNIIQEALSFHQAGKLAEAEELYKKVLRQDDRNVDAIHYLGVLAHQCGHHAQAAQIISEAVALNPKYVQAHNNLALVYKSLGDIEAACQAYKRVIELEPGNESAIIDLGNLWLHTGRFHEAITHFRSARNRLGDSPQIAFALGLSLQMKGALEQSVAAYRSALNLDSTMVDAYLNLAVVLTEIGNAEDALRISDIALNLDPANPNLHYNKGNAFLSLGSYQKAASCYRTTIHLNPEFGQAWCNLGNSLSKQEEWSAAEEAYAKSLELDPQCGETHNNLGVIFLEVNQHSKAAEHFQNAIRINDKYVDAYINLANTHHAVGDHSAAIKCYEFALSLDAHNSKSLNNYGIFLRELGQYQSAIELFRKGLASETISKQESIQLLSNLAGALFVLGDHEEAEQILLQIQQLDPDDPIPFLEHARFTRMSGNDKQSQESYLKGVNLIPAPEEKALKTRIWPTSTGNAPTITALLSFGRSGTMFFQSLFDGHPQVSTIPGVYLRGYFGRGVWKKLHSSAQHPQWKYSLVDRFCAEFQGIFDAENRKPVHGNPMGRGAHVGHSCGLTRLGPNRDQALKVSEEGFRVHLHELLKDHDEIGAGTFFMLVHLAYARARNHVGKVEQILYHVHNPDIYELSCLLKTCPDTRLIQLVRNPVQSLESWIKNLWPASDESARSDSEVDTALYTYQRIAERISSLFENTGKPEFGLAQSRAVRLEDLKASPRKTLCSIAEWMGIKDDTSLYSSSFSGMEFWGPPSKLSPELKGFDDSNIQRKSAGVFSSRDTRILETLFFPFRNYHGYGETNPGTHQENRDELEGLLDEPFDFERKLYETMEGERIPQEQMGPFLAIRKEIQRRWRLLDRSDSSVNMPKTMARPNATSENTDQKSSS